MKQNKNPKNLSTTKNKTALKTEFTEDKRKAARQEHTNHFTSRTSEKK